MGQLQAHGSIEPIIKDIFLLESAYEERDENPFYAE